MKTTTMRMTMKTIMITFTTKYNYSLEPYMSMGAVICCGRFFDPKKSSFFFIISIKEYSNWEKIMTKGRILESII